MSDELPSCDPEAMESDRAEHAPSWAPTDPWLRRRAMHWGASEIAPLLIALDWRPQDAFGTTTLAQSRRIIARKAGLSRPLKRTEPMLLGKQREAEVVARWLRLLRAGSAGSHAAAIDVDSVCYVEGLPESVRVLSPAVDHYCHRLSASLDCAAFDLLGRQGTVDIKCSYRPYDDVKPAHVVQLTAQMAVTGADWGVIVEGRGYSNTWWDDKPRPIRTHRIIERDDALVDEIRLAAVVGWAAVERLRAQRETA